ELKRTLLGATIDSFQAIGPRSFLMRIIKRPPLLLCLQEPFLRFHLSTQPLKGFDNAFTQTLSSKLTGAVIASIAQLNQDRILEITLPHYRLIVELFPKRPNLYLLEGDKILLTHQPVSQSHYSLPSQPAQSPHAAESPLLTSGEIERHYAELELQNAKHQL